MAEEQHRLHSLIKCIASGQEALSKDVGGIVASQGELAEELAALVAQNPCIGNEMSRYDAKSVTFTKTSSSPAGGPPRVSEAKLIGSSEEAEEPKPPMLRAASKVSVPESSSVEEQMGGARSIRLYATQSKNPSWPVMVPLRSGLVSSGRASRPSESAGIIRSLTRTATHTQLADLTALAPRARGCINDPNSWHMIAIDVMSIFALLHDLILTPFYISLDVEVKGVLALLEWLTAVFWLSNFLLSFITGFYQRGELNMNPRAIVLNYAKTWMLPDLFLLVLDWTVIFVTMAKGSDPTQKSAREVLRLVRVGRFLKVFRLIRLYRLLDKMSTLSLSRATRLAMQVVQIAFLLLIYNHLVCCMWCFIGRNHIHISDTDLSWFDYPVGGKGNEVSLLEMDNMQRVRDADVWQQYITGFHWTMAQMTPGPIDIVAANSIERIFNSVILILGLFFGSGIVSLFSGHIMQAIMLRRHKNQQLDMVRRYLRQKAIAPKLAVRVQRQVMERLSEDRPLKVEDVPAFELVSVALRRRLLHETRRPHLVTHPAFKLWADMDMGHVHSLCEEAVQTLDLSSQDELFVALTPADTAYYVMRGALTYTQDPTTSKVFEVTQTPVTPGHNAWFCEVALWSAWEHVGRMEVDAPSQVLAINALRLMKALEKETHASNLIKQYGRNFHVRITSAVPPLAPWPSDLSVPFTDISDLLSQHVGLGLLQKALDRREIDLSPDQVEELREQVKREKCALRENASGALERIIAVVALHLTRQDGKVLAQVGEWSESGGISVDFKLPGRKRAMGELPHKALDALMADSFSSCSSLIQMQRVEHKVFKKPSSVFQMPTTYMRTVHFGVLDSSLETLPFPVVHPPKTTPGHTTSSLCMSTTTSSLKISQATDSKRSSTMDSPLTKLYSVTSGVMTARSSGEAKESMRPIPPRDVHVLTTNSKAAKLFTWFDPDEFDRITEGPADLFQKICPWVATIQVEKACDDVQEEEEEVQQDGQSSRRASRRTTPQSI